MIRPKILFFISVILFSLSFLPDCIRQVGGDSRWLAPMGGYLYSQPVKLEWMRNYDDPDHKGDIPSGMVVYLNGNVYVTGESQFPSNQTYFATVKYNATGTQQWVKTYYEINSPSNEPRGISIDSSGFIFVYGISGSDVSGIYHSVLIKYNSNGDSLWVKKYYGGGSNYTTPYSIANDSKGNTYITGGGDYYNIFLLKYNNIGDTIWTCYYRRPGYSSSAGYSLTLNENSNIYVGAGCWINYPYPGRGDFLILKYDSIGTLKWAEVDSFPQGMQNISKIAIDRQENVFAIGASSDLVGNNTKYLTVKYNINGVFQWQRFYFQIADAPSDIVTDDFGNSYVTGESYSNLFGGDIYTTIKYDAAGDSLWVKHFGFHDGAATGSNKMCIDYLSNIYVFGVYIDSVNNSYFSTVKYNTNGIQQWLINYPVELSSAATYNISVDQLSNVYITAGGLFQSNNLNYITIKYSQLVGIANENTKNQRFKLYTNYPNPFNPSTNIIYEIGIRSNVKMDIYDILGRKVYEYPLQIKEAGYYKELWDGSNFSSGVYFCKLTVSYQKNNNEKEFIQTIPMVLAK